MRSQVTVSWGDPRNTYAFDLEEVQPMPHELARSWLDEQFAFMGCEPIRPTGKVLTDWVGNGRLKKYGVRFVNQVWPGDSLTTTATVEAIREEDGQHYADFTVVTLNQDDKPVVTGTASALIDP